MDCDKKWNSLRHGLYKMKSVALALVILMQFNAFAARTWGADNDLLMKLERGWNHLQLLDEEQSSYTIKRQSYDPKIATLQNVAAAVKIDRKPGYFRETITTDTEMGVFGYNPKYSFSLGKRAGKGAYLSRITLTEPGIANPDIQATLQFGSATRKYYPLSHVHHQPGPELLKNTSLVLVASRPGPDGSLEVDVRFDVALPGSQRPPLPVALTLTVDPAKYYCVKGFRFAPSMGDRKDVEFVRVIGERGRLVCTRTELKQISKGFHEVEEFQDYDFTHPIPDSEYYLSHYGLPEPVGLAAPVKVTPTFVWLIVGAAVAATLAIVLGRLTKGSRVRHRN